MVILNLRKLDDEEENILSGPFPGFGEGDISYLLKLNFASEEVGAEK